MIDPEPVFLHQYLFVIIVIYIGYREKITEFLHERRRANWTLTTTYEGWYS